MSRVKLTIATTDYDHFRHFPPSAPSEGIDRVTRLAITRCSHAFTSTAEVGDISELSFAKFCAQVTRPTPTSSGCRWCSSRLFQFSSFYVNRRTRWKTVADLKGPRQSARPEWPASTCAAGSTTSTASACTTSTDQAGASRIKGQAQPAQGREAGPVNDKSLSEMIATGRIDCALVARPPNSFLQGNPDVVHLFPDYLEMEESYYERTKVWPISCTCVRSRPGALDEHPWVARNLYNALVEIRSAAASVCILRSHVIHSPGFRLTPARWRFLRRRPVPYQDGERAPTGPALHP